MKKRIDILRGLWYILTHEWVNHSPMRPGQTCAIISFENSRWPVRNRNVGEALRRAVGRYDKQQQFWFSTASVIAWNDHPDRTKAQVVRLYLSAAAHG